MPRPLDTNIRHLIQYIRSEGFNIDLQHDEQGYRIFDSNGNDMCSYYKNPREMTAWIEGFMACHHINTMKTLKPDAV